MTTITIIHFATVSEWLSCLTEVYGEYQRSMWQFVVALRAGVDQFGRTSHEKADLYRLAAEQLQMSPKTVQNYVSASRKASTEYAIELGLEIGHAVAVLGLENDEAEAVLTEAAEQGLSVEATRHRAHVRKQDIPDVGKRDYAAHGTPDTDEGNPLANDGYYDEGERGGVYCPHCGARIG